MKLVVLLCLLLGSVSDALAAWHVYFVSVIGTGTRQDPRRAKYLGAPSACMDYGFQPIMLCATDVDNTTDTTLSALADVHRLPDNLDQPLGTAALAVVQNAMENRNIPSEWVTNTITYRELLRTVGGMFAFLQRYGAVANTSALLLGGVVDLNTRINQLPVAVRQNLQATATDLGLDSSGITGANTIRQILKNLADQWGQRPILLGGVVI